MFNLLSPSFPNSLLVIKMNTAGNTKDKRLSVIAPTSPKMKDMSLSVKEIVKTMEKSAKNIE